LIYSQLTCYIRSSS